MKRFMLSFAAIALMLVAADNASAQSIRIVNSSYPAYYPSSSVIYSSGYPVYSTPYYSTPYYSTPYYSTPVYTTYPSSSFYYNSGRVGIGYSSGYYGGGWGAGYRFGGGGWGGRGWRR
jgi:hypothetical protein